MSLVTEYRSSIRNKLGLSEEDPVMGSGETDNSNGSMGGIGSMDAESLNSMLELLSREIAKREAVGETEIEPEGMEEPIDAGATDAGSEQPQIPATPGASVSIDESQQVADDVYFEMLNTFKTNIGNCQDSNRKKMYSKCYEMCYKMREKFIKEMVAVEEPSATPIH